MSSTPDLYELYQQHLAGMSAPTPSPDEARAWLWLAALPSWDSDLARAAGFPTPDLKTFVDSTARRGWCERVADERLDGTPRIAFWVAPTRRHEVVSAVQQHLDRPTIEDEIRRIASGMAKSRVDEGDVPTGVRCWQQLLPNRKTSFETASSVLSQHIATAVGEGDTGAALDWLQAGDPLAQILGEPVAGAVSRGRRRVAREYQRVVDRRRLDRYLVRGEQRDSLADLMDQPDQATPARGVYWALHAVGMGGVGKTMLVRYLAGSFAADTGRKTPLAVARIDFDHAEHRFRSTEPGLLLLHLASDLAFESPNEATEEAFHGLEHRVRELHRRIAEPGAAPGFDDAGGFSEPMVAAIDAFCGLCRSVVKDGRRVVLVLDTCEELAKHHPPGQAVVGIERLFDLLTEIHRREPTIRVLFAGRRLLARAGHEWQADTEAALPGGIVSLKSRPFLAMVELRGFTNAEVDQYLYDVRKLVVDPATRARMTASAGEVGRVQGLQIADPDERRPNPFDIDLYASIFEEQGPKAAFDVNAYVRSRIVGRLDGRRLEQVLPAVALLGRFDETMIHASLGVDGAAMDDTLQRLGEQEWIDVSVDERDTQWLTVESGLRDRLAAYFEGTGRLASAAETLGPALRELVLSRHLDDVEVDHLVWAVRLSDPTEAVDLWDDLEERGESEEGWPLLARAAETLLARDDAGRIGATAYAIESFLRIALLADARRQADHEPVPGQWQAILDAAPRLPDERLAGIVQARARLGLLTESWTKEGDGLELDVALASVHATLPDELDPRLAAALVAALDRLLDHCLGAPLVLAAARPAPDHLPAQFPSIDSWWAIMDPLLAAFFRCVHARWVAATMPTRDDVAWLAFETAHREAEEALNAEAPPERWADWSPPGDILARIRLQWLLHCWRCGTEVPDSVVDWEFYLESFDIDVERLASLGLQFGLGRAMLDDELIDQLIDAGQSPRLLRPTCLAHQQVPPLVVSTAEVLSQRGDPEAALRLLEQTVAYGTSATGRREPGGGPSDVAVDALRAAVRIVRSFRLDDDAWVLRRAAPVPALGVAVEEARALLARQPWPYRLRLPAQSDFTRYFLSHGLSSVPKPASSDERPPLDTSLGLYDLDDPDMVTSGLAEIEVRARRGHGALHELDRLDRVWIGMLASAAVGVWLPDRLEAWTRRFRVLAQEEAELVALRWPERGVRLLDVVHERQTETHKLIGFMAELTSVMAGLRAGHTYPSATADELLIAYQRAAPKRFDDIDDGPLRLPTGDAGPLAGMESRLTATVRAIRDPSSVGTTDEVTCPELAFVTAPPAPPETSSGRRRPRDLGEKVAGLVLGVAFWPLMVVLYRLIRNAITGDDVSWVDAAGELFVGLFLIALPFYVVTFFLSSRRVPWTEMRIRSDWARDEPSVTADLDVWARAVRSDSRVASVIRWVFANTVGFVRAVAARLRWQGAHPIDVDTQDWSLGGSLPELLSDGVLGWRATRPAKRYVVVFELAGDADELAWEDWRGGELAPHKLHHLREVIPVVDALPPRRVADEVAVLGERSWHSFTTRCWAAKGRSIVTRTKPEQLGPVEGGVLHLLGVPVLTQTGWWLRIDDARPGIKVAEGVEVLVGSEHLDVQRSALVVVQGRPDHPLDYESLAGLRAIAGDIASSAGAAAVIVIPSLPSAVAENVLETLARLAFAGRPPGRRKLLEWTQRLRRIVHDEVSDVHSLQVVAVTHTTDRRRT